MEYIINIERSKSMEKTKRNITIAVDGNLYAELERLASKSGVNMIATVVRQAIIFYLKNNTSRNCKTGIPAERY